MKQLISSRTLVIPDDVQIEVKARRVRVKGPRGEWSAAPGAAPGAAHAAWQASGAVGGTPRRPPPVPGRAGGPAAGGEPAGDARGGPRRARRSCEHGRRLPQPLRRLVAAARWDGRIEGRAARRAAV